MQTHKRILLLYISEISGHHTATIAIEKALKLLEPNIQTLNLNAFNYTHPTLERIINRAYLGVIKKTPKVWEYLYDNPAIVKRTQSIKEAIHKFNHHKFQVLFEDFKPEAVVCTQAFPCGMVADYKETFNLRIPLFAILTDYMPHAYWLHQGVDYYVVASEEARDRFLSEGIPQERIKTLGIPIDPKFAQTLSGETIARGIGLDINIPTILIMGGGQGIGPIKRIIKILSQLPLIFQLIVVAGTNKRLLKWLKTIKLYYNKKILIFEYVNNIDELMAASQILISKPGGLTTAEALSKGLVMILVRPIPGQEVNNTEYLLKRDVAIRVERIEEINRVLEELLNNSPRLDKMRNQAREISKPNAALDIAKLILNYHV